jgi:ParB family chromosome partitioning protein
MRIPISSIIVSKDNPRQSFDEEGLRRLGESIKEHGQLQAIIVRPSGSNYELVVGERRYRASKLVGLVEIDATVQDLNDATCMEFRLIENTQREDLTEAEKGNAVAILLEKYPEKYATIDVLAKELQKSYTTVNTWLQKSERLSNQIKKFTELGKLSEDIAAYLLKFDHATQNKLANAIVQYKVKSGETGIEYREFIRRYGLDPEKYPTVESLEDLANEVKGIKRVKIDLDKLSPRARSEVERKLKEAKEEAKAIRKKTPKPRTNYRRQGRPPKTKKQPTSEPEEKKPIPAPTFPIADVKVVAVAINFPEPLWERVLQYTTTTDKPMLVEEAVISLLESHPLLKGL